MRSILTLTAGVVLGYVLNEHKEQSIEWIARSISDSSVEIGSRVREFFSTSVETVD